jgi:hypothetical protein
MLDLANIGFAPRQQPLKLLAFGKGEGHPVLLGHGRPPVSTGPHNNNLQPTPSALTEDQWVICCGLWYSGGVIFVLRGVPCRATGKIPFARSRRMSARS